MRMRPLLVRKVNTMFDKEIDHYTVDVYDYVSSIGGYRKTPLKTLRFDTDDEAVAFARKELDKGNKVRVQQICNIVGWWEEK